MSQLKLHNAMWPGLVGKEPNTDHPPISLERMLELTANANVNGQKFEGVDLFLFHPHTDPDISEENLRKMADQIAAKGLNVGSLVAPVWGGTVGDSAMGTDEQQKKFLLAIEKACRIAKQLNQHGVRKYGIIRLDTANSPAHFNEDPVGNQKRNIETIKEAARIAESYGEQVALEGEICWGGMHSWKALVELLEGVDNRKTVGIQADMAHTLLFMLGYNAPEASLVPAGFNWEKDAFDKAYTTLTDKLRPWVKDFHIAQNDATVKGQGSHDKTGKHCPVDDPNGKLDIPYHAGFWLRNPDGSHIDIKHMCWDGCMFSNPVMESQETWNKILGAMVAVRDRHGWN